MYYSVLLGILGENPKLFRLKSLHPQELPLLSMVDWKIPFAENPAEIFLECPIGRESCSFNQKSLNACVHDNRKECYNGWDEKEGRWRTCLSDEHYASTLLAVEGREEETDCRLALVPISVTVTGVGNWL